MSTPNYGGPAFPQHGWTSNPEVLERMKGQGGMSLRDWFAGHALHGILSNHDLLEILDKQSPTLPTRHMAAQHAYGFADAMLKERDWVGDKDAKP